MGNKILLNLNNGIIVLDFPNVRKKSFFLFKNKFQKKEGRPSLTMETYCERNMGKGIKQKIIRLAFLAGLSLSPVTQASPMHLVAMINFDCPHCADASNFFQVLENRVDGQGGEFIVAPLPGSEDYVLRERFYYAADLVNNKAGKMVIRTLFDAAKSKYLIESYEELATLMQIEYPNSFDWGVIAKKAESRSVDKRLHKAIVLANDVGMRTFPSFITFDGTNKELIIAPGSIPEQISKVLSKIQGD